MKDTTLTHAQLSKLDAIAEGDEAATVVGWDDDAHGPVILMGDGMTRRAINPHGRLHQRRSRI